MLTRPRHHILRKSIASAVFAFLIASSASAQPAPVPFELPARYDGHRVASVHITTQEDRARVEAISSDPWNCSGPRDGWARYRFSPDEFDRLRASGMEFRIEIDNVQNLIDRERAEIDNQNFAQQALGPADAAWYTAYKTYDQYNAYTDTLIAAYPGMVSRVALGNSLQGNAVWAIRIASPGSAATKPAFFFFALQHSREWVTGMAAMYIAEQLASGNNADPQTARALQTYQFFIVPIANPDGYKYTWSTNRLWRKNRRTNAGGSFGVDLNRNWSQGWGSNNGSSGTPSNDTYRGTAAFSEPETQLLRDFVVARPYIRSMLDVHSYSQLILSPWGYTSTLPTNASLYTDLNATFKSGVQSPFATPYTAGPTYTTIYPVSGGSTDWGAAQSRLAWGMECRDTGTFGFELPAAQIVPQGQELLKGILNLIDSTSGPVHMVFPSGQPPVSVTASTATQFSVHVYDMLSTFVPGTATLSYRIGRLDGFTDVSLTLVSGNQYLAALPPLPCGAVLQYRLTATGANGLSETVPASYLGPWIQATAKRANGTACTVCPADFGQDGIINPDDLGDYITLYFQSDTLTEFNNDGFLNPDDLGDYITEYFSNSCVPG